MVNNDDENNCRNIATGLQGIEWSGMECIEIVNVDIELLDLWILVGLGPAHRSIL